MAGGRDLGPLGERLLGYLARTFEAPDLAFAAPLEELPGGTDTFVGAFSLSGAPDELRRPLVLRLYPADASQVRPVREATVQTVLSELGYPAPRVFAVEPSAKPLGASFIVMERLPGRSLLSGMEVTRSAGVTLSLASFVASVPRMLRDLPHALATLHAELHGLDIAPIRRALEDAGVPLSDREVGTVVDRLEAGIARERERDAARDEPLWADAEAGIAWLRRHVPAHDGPPALCHGDFHPNNILFEEGRLAGIIDWTDVLFGDPACDVGRTKFLLDFAPLDPPAALRPVVDRLQRRLGRRYLALYCARRDMDERAVRYYAVLWCFERFIVIHLRRKEKDMAEAVSARTGRDPFDRRHSLARLIAFYEGETGLSMRLPPP